MNEFPPCVNAIGDTAAVNEPQTIGIVACSAEGAALCYRTICERAPHFLGPHAHPEIVLHAQSLARYVQALNDRDLQGVAQLMLRSANVLAAAGVDFLVCPDNTIHSALELVRPVSPLPWLDIAEVVATAARTKGISKVALLGTHWLLESKVYPKALAAVGIDFLLPEVREREAVSRIIMTELVNSIRLETSRRYLLDLIEQMRSRGCDAVVLGCTELPLIIDEGDAVLPTLDSTRLLADAALQRARLPLRHA